MTKIRLQIDAAQTKRFLPTGGLEIAVLAMALLVVTAGCVRRTITMTTEPAHALIYLNDQEVGRGPVTTDFLWYGDYDVVIRKKEYKTLKTHWQITPPWYQQIPFDFFAEVLWPGLLHDEREKHFVLVPQELPTREELLKRASDTRQRALDPRD